MSATLCVVGAGRSGAVAAAGLAEMGHTVCAVDIDARRVEDLRSGKAPFHEHGLDDLLASNIAAGRLSFTDDFASAVAPSDAVLLCVPTPAASDGNADLSILESALQDVMPHLRSGTLLITRSTVPVGTNASIAAELRRDWPQVEVGVASNPEFLREGHAVADFMSPERIVIGAANADSGARAAALYESVDCPVLLTNWETAEVTKYAANAYLAASISFINEIANLCELAGADVTQVTEALKLDSRIGEQAYINPGIGFGGSCLPKDISALVRTAERHDYTPSLLKAVIDVNALQPQRVVGYLTDIFSDLGSRSVAVLGISFKGDTFDVRSSPAMSVIRYLSKTGATIRAFDPLADGTAAECAGEVAQLCEDPYEAASGCDALVIATEHSQFHDLDLGRLAKTMASHVIIDGRNMLDPVDVAKAGFSYIGIGRARRGD